MQLDAGAELVGQDADELAEVDPFLAGEVEDDAIAAERAVWAGLEMLKAVKELNAFLEQLSYQPLNLSIGIHYGEAVLVPVDSNKPNFVTP
jgi:adenylate cyclase